MFCNNFSNYFIVEDVGVLWQLAG